MLTGLVLVVFLICYCCHRNMRKNSDSRSAQYWQEQPGVPLEVFTVDEQVSRLATTEPEGSSFFQTTAIL
jgi:hypothetical protein